MKKKKNEALASSNLAPSTQIIDRTEDGKDKVLEKISNDEEALKLHLASLVEKFTKDARDKAEEYGINLKVTVAFEIES